MRGFVLSLPLFLVLSFSSFFCLHAQQPIYVTTESEMNRLKSELMKSEMNQRSSESSVRMLDIQLQSLKKKSEELMNLSEKQKTSIETLKKLLKESEEEGLKRMNSMQSRIDTLRGSVNKWKLRFFIVLSIMMIYVSIEVIKILIKLR